MSIFVYAKRNIALIALILFSLLLRLYPIFPDYFSFMYDNAKDSLVLMDMGLNRHIPVIGTATSIDGVFNGPLWYYFLFPFNVIGQYHPLSSIAAVLFLTGISITVLWKFFGRTEAYLFGISAGLIGAQQSAWSPWATPFPVLGMLVFLHMLAKKTRRPLFTTALLGLCVSLLFHLQTAFGIVMLPITLVSLFLLWRHKRRTRISRMLCAFFTGFVPPFIPSLLFELRHGFIQTHQVVNFIKNFGSQAQIIAPRDPNLFSRVTEVFLYYTNTLASAVSPVSVHLPLVGVFLIYALIYILLFRTKVSERIILLPYLIGVPLLYLILPVKPYYFAGLLPFFILAGARMLRTLPRGVRTFVMLLLFALSVAGMVSGRTTSAKLAQTHSFLFKPKVAAVKEVLRRAERGQFSSYHYVPEIYDYTYQFIYLYLAQTPHTLPSSFSYLPGEYAYMTAMQHAVSEDTQHPVFLIEESPTNGEYFQRWSGSFPAHENPKEVVRINDVIRVIVLP